MSALMTVTERALVARIKRKLAHDEETISYGPDPWTSGKTWRRVDVRSNTITASYDDVTELARDLGVMHENERVAA